LSESWHLAVARALAVPALADEVAEFEIAFGRARENLAYVLELARAHRLPVSGNVAGDDVWVAFGQARVRFTLNRREGLVELRSLRGKQRLAWSKPLRAVVDDHGRTHDLAAIARWAIDELVTQWQTADSPRLPIPSAREFEDEPTKG
jgi:hypothetical protein